MFEIRLTAPFTAWLAGIRDKLTLLRLRRRLEKRSSATWVMSNR
jgi:hypothetical protein